MENRLNALYQAPMGENMSYSVKNGGTNATYFWDKSGKVWDLWVNYYYPEVINKSYPVYIQHRAEDKGKQAFEIIKMLKDKKLIKLDTVGDFIDAMDELIKIL